MSFRKKVDDRLSRKQKAFEIKSLMKNKRSEDYQVIEEVFDRSTLMVIYDFMNKGIIDEIHGVVNAGKEARVYWGKDALGNELAIKIYLTSSSEFKKGMIPYIEGDPRFAHIRRDTRWAGAVLCVVLAGAIAPATTALAQDVKIVRLIQLRMARRH